MANTIKFGNGQWATKEDSILAYNDENANFKPLPFVTSRATTATRVNKAGLLETVASGVPRVDYLDNSKGSYLLEPTSRNLIAQSEAFGNSYWTKSGASIQGDASTVGSEQVVNGNFATDSDWTKQTGWTISGGGANYDFLSNVKYIRQTLLNGGIVSGNTYQINFEITSGTAYISINSNSGVLISSNTYSVGSHSISINASVSGSDLLIYGRNTQGTAFSIDNVSVKEVQGFSAPSVDSPLGAFKLVANSINSDIFRINSGISGVNYSNSLYMKRVTGIGSVYLKNANNVHQLVELTNEWKRFDNNAISNSTTLLSGVRISTSGDEIMIFGAQLEPQSSSTSYIPTAGTAISRTAESASKSGISSLINSSEGVLYFEGSILADNVPTQVISLFGSADSRVSITFNDTLDRIQLYVAINGYTNTVSLTSDGVDRTQSNKIAVRYGANNYALFLNGVKVEENIAQGNIFTVGSLTKLTFSDSNDFYGNCKDLRVYNTALTDAELQTLTTI